MNNEILQEVSCPNCQNPIDVRAHGVHITCDACSSHFILNGHMCPQCHSYHREEKSFCAHCGAALTRVCLRCKSSNWAGEEFCAHCGEPLDIFELLSLQQRDARQKMLEQRRHEIRHLRQEEELASNRRMEELQAIEAERQALLRQRLAVQRRQQRKLLMLAFGAVALFILVLFVYAFVSFVG